MKAGHSDVPQQEKQAPAGISLSTLLSRVRQAVSTQVQPAWTFVDVTSVRQTKHLWLELAQRDEQGNVLAKCGASIWAQRAARIVSGFEEATGVKLAGGIKLLVLAKPVFHPSFGFSVEIEAIDPAFTLGELEARKRAIREQLKQEGLFDLQRRLPAPWDYRFVLVIAPESAAGLGDFQVEAQKLSSARVCKFVYRHSLFQGEQAGASIADTLGQGLQQAFERTGVMPDAVAIIRGGGAVNDLAWLNDYQLARAVCEAPVPVITGIGHERDSTIVDEVAHTCYDTPSKVAAGIERVIVQRTQEARAMFELVQATARQSCSQVDRQIATMHAQIASGAHTMLRAVQSEVQACMQAVQSGATGSIHKAGATAQEAMHAIGSSISRGLVQVSAAADAHMGAVTQHASWAVSQARQDIEREVGQVRDGAARAVEQARAETEGAIREVTGMGPSKTLSRGFAMVRAADGKTITSAEHARAAHDVQVVFHDGAVSATVSPNNTQERPQ